MVIDMNGPNIELVDEVKTPIISILSVNVEELQEEDTVKKQCRCNPTE